MEKLNKGLLSLKLPLEYMAMMVHAGSEPSKASHSKVRKKGGTWGIDWDGKKTYSNLIFYFFDAVPQDDFWYCHKETAIFEPECQS